MALTLPVLGLERRAADLFLLAVVTIIGAILRIEALVAAYGPAPLLPALEGFQRQIAQLGPWLHGGRLAWSELGERSGDPVAYLNNARAMTWFYEGRAREPVFNYATQWGLWLTDNADIGVSLASTTFSVLTVAATYVLGRLAVGRVAGVAAALVVAIDPTMIAWGIQGWRDDTFTFFVLSFAACSLRFDKTPSVSNAVLLTIAVTLALLTRLTAISFIAPAMLVLGWRRWLSGSDRRVAIRRLVGAALAATLLVAPYLFNCWQRYGDPLVAINRNTTFYRERAGLDATEQMSAGAYLAMLARDRPVRTMDTALQGMTTYPFRNKFHTLGPWGPLLPSVLPILAVIGLLAWPWSASGRLVLLILIFSLAPYAFTWEVTGGAEWRFTMHAYPVYLVAAMAGAALSFAVVRAALVNRSISRRHLAQAAVSLGVGLLLAASLLWLPFLRAQEALRLDGRAVVAPGWRDRVFFRTGWEPAEDGRGGATRRSLGARATVHLPVVPGRAFRISAEVAPAAPASDRPLFLRASLDGRLMAERQVSVDAGAFVFDLAAASVRGTRAAIELQGRRPFGPGSVASAGEGADGDSRFVIRSIHVVAIEGEDASATGSKP